MAKRRQITPEEAIEALDHAIRKGEVNRSVLLQLTKLGLEVQKLWKAIHHVETGRIGQRQGAEIAGVDEERFRELLARNPRPPRSGG